MAELKFKLHSPLTEEDWDLITDVDLDHTPSVMFHTKHGKDIEYVKAKHGRWVPVTNGRGGFECSICHNYSPSYQNGDVWLAHYCPTCGADMREVEE